MYIVQGVAAAAGLGRILVFLINMAGIAGGILVGAVQRKVGFVVVKIEFFPAFHRVAAVAIVAQVSLVGILLAVTTLTGRRGLGIFFTRFMTGAAGDRGMRTLQGEIGTPVVKRQWVQPDNVSVPTQVFAVTAFTRRGGNVGKAPVVASLALNVLVDIFVAVEAQPRLRGFTEPGMAFTALGFQFGVTLNNLARHQQRFNIQRLRQTRCRHKYCCHSHHQYPFQSVHAFSSFPASTYALR